MKGFQITFFTQQDRKYKGQSLAEWLLAFAHRHGVQEAVLAADGEGYDDKGRFHSTHFFELADQPLEVRVAADEETTQRMFAALAQEDVAVFYVKTPVEFGLVGRAAC